jgi:hypothetical protein
VQSFWEWSKTVAGWGVGTGQLLPIAELEEDLIVQTPELDGSLTDESMDQN